jgi:UDP-N-acetylmuramoyl-tripeptide--D-alanyl-D-alanine ligase
VRAGLDVLRSLPGPTWLVLGDMAELGEASEDSHSGIGVYARDAGVKRLFAVGPLSSRAVETFGSGGEWFADVDSLIRRLSTELTSNVTLLIKGSRVNKLERVVLALLGGGAGVKSMMRASSCC